MQRQLKTIALTTGLVLGALVVQGQSGLFFNEGWESGTLTGSFNSSYYGSLGSQYRVDTVNRASGTYSLFHQFIAGMAPDAIQYATQHFGDAPAGPVPVAGRGQHFYDLYIQYKFYYSPGFDFSTGHYKQFIIGTQDSRRHDEACCVPWSAHYIITLVHAPNIVEVHVNPKQPTVNPYDWRILRGNQNGYSDANPFHVQSGRWYTVELRRRLNDAGVDNGIYQMWIDHQLIMDYRDVRFRIPPSGAYGTDFTYGTNFAMISDYTPRNVSQNQFVQYDDVQFSTSAIGGSAPPRPPTNVRVIR